MPAPHGVRYLPELLPDPDADLAFLTADVTWNTGMRARRTASFGVPYNYSGQRYDAAPIPDRIAAIASLAGTHAGHPFTNCLANRYDTGDNSMGFHRDSYAELVPGSAIAIVSLGVPRRLVFRSHDGARVEDVVMGHGSLLLMTEETQRGWVHAVPREPGAGLRFSLTFRQFTA